jgi:hypothetical protein
MPEGYDIALCLKCGLFMIAGYRLRAETKDPADYARIESIVLHLEKQYPDKPIRQTITDIADGLRNDPEWRETMLGMKRWPDDER